MINFLLIINIKGIIQEIVQTCTISDTYRYLKMQNTFR